MEDTETKRRGRPPGSGKMFAVIGSVAQDTPTEGIVAPACDTPPREQSVSMRVVRDFWNDEGERVAAGTVVSVSVKAALRGVKSGALDIIED